MPRAATGPPQGLGAAVADADEAPAVREAGVFVAEVKRLATGGVPKHLGAPFITPPPPPPPSLLLLRQGVNFWSPPRPRSTSLVGEENTDETPWRPRPCQEGSWSPHRPQTPPASPSQPPADPWDLFLGARGVRRTSWSSLSSLTAAEEAAGKLPPAAAAARERRRLRAARAATSPATSASPTAPPTAPAMMGVRGVGGRTWGRGKGSREGLCQVTLIRDTTWTHMGKGTHGHGHLGFGSLMPSLQESLRVVQHMCLVK